jgi:Short C-terminal domain
MGNETGTTIDQLEKADKKVAKLLQANLSDGEQVELYAQGNSDQTVVLTDRHVFILKTGFMAGQSFGGKATSFAYGQITAVEVRVSMMSGIFEIRAAGMSATDISYYGNSKDSAYKAPNAIPINKNRAALFQDVAKRIRERIDATHSAQAPSAASPPPADIPGQLRQLAELRDAGVVTPEEFASKKSELLARM